MNKENYDILLEVVKEVFQDPEMFKSEESLRRGMTEAIKFFELKKAAQTIKPIKKVCELNDAQHIIDSILQEKFDTSLESYWWHDTVTQIKQLDAESDIVRTLASRLQWLVKNGWEFTIPNILRTRYARPYRGTIKVNTNIAFFSPLDFMNFVYELYKSIKEEHDYQIEVSSVFNALIKELCNKED